LLTNNPKKSDGLIALGTRVTERVPHVMAANDYNRSYLETKARRSGHLIEMARSSDNDGAIPIAISAHNNKR
ncbi:MAG TPA: GTP cyclohydrolase II, partial [Myxococcota bacterium]